MEGILTVALAIVLASIILFSLPYIIGSIRTILDWIFIIALVGSAIALLFYYPKEVGINIRSLGGLGLLAGIISVLGEFIKSLKAKWVILTACVLPLLASLSVYVSVYLFENNKVSFPIIGFLVITGLFLLLSYFIFVPTILHKLAVEKRN